MMAYLGDTTTAHNAAPPPRSTTTTPARVTYPCSHRQCQLGVQGVGAEQRNPLTLPSYHRLESRAWRAVAAAAPSGSSGAPRLPSSPPPSAPAPAPEPGSLVLGVSGAVQSARERLWCLRQIETSRDQGVGMVEQTWRTSRGVVDHVASSNDSGVRDGRGVTCGRRNHTRQTPRPYTIGSSAGTSGDEALQAGGNVSAHHSQGAGPFGLRPRDHCGL